MKTFPLFRYLFYLTLISIITSETKANEIKTASTIKAVTVYNDQALITRAATVNMPTGVHTIIFTGLPDIMIDQSLKVSGVSEYEAKISDIKIERLFLDTLPAAHLTDLYQRLYNLRVEKNALDRTNLLYKSQADAVDMLLESWPTARGLEYRQALLRALSISRHDRAIEFLQRLAADGRPQDAADARAALALFPVA